jgi:hypothetical protein
VVILGTQLTTRSDSAGRFFLPGIPPGVFSVAFNHPRLDTLRAFPAAAEVEIRSQARSEVVLGVPSLGTILAAACVFQSQPPGTAPLVGRVSVVPTGQPVPRARVTVSWEGGSEGDAAGPTERIAVTDGTGRYAICGAPAGREATAEATFFGHESDPTPVRMNLDTHTVLDLGISLPSGFLTARTGADVREEGTGTQGVQGWIREPDTGAPVRGAEVVLRQTPGTIVVTGETSRRGFFRLQTPVPGIYSVEATALGYGEVLVEYLEVESGQLTILEVTMAPAPLELEPIVAVGESRGFQLEVQGFYDRMERGFGHFITPEELEAWNPLDFAQIFRRIPGIRVSPVGGFGAVLTVSRASFRQGPECTPRLYVDGAIVSTARMGGDTLGVGVNPAEVMNVRDLDAVEFYPGAATVPLVWATMGEGDCGTVVLWSKTGPGGG